MNSIACDLYVDISGADCTAPVSKLSDALEVMLPGQRLLAVSKKEALLSDIPAYCRSHNLRLVDQGEMDEMLYFLMQLQS